MFGEKIDGACRRDRVLIARLRHDPRETNLGERHLAHPSDRFAAHPRERPNGEHAAPSRMAINTFTSNKARFVRPSGSSPASFQISLALKPSHERSGNNPAPRWQDDKTVAFDQRSRAGRAVACRARSEMIFPVVVCCAAARSSAAASTPSSCIRCKDARSSDRQIVVLAAWHLHCLAPQ